MGRNATGNTGKFGTFLKELVNTGYIQISTGPGTGEKDIFRTPIFEPILCEKIKILLRQNRIWDISTDRETVKSIMKLATDHNVSINEENRGFEPATLVWDGGAGC